MKWKLNKWKNSVTVYEHESTNCCLQKRTLEWKHDEPPLEVDTFIWFLPLSVSLSLSPTAEDGRLWEDVLTRFPEAERFLVSDDVLPPPLFWYSMGDWRATITHRFIYIIYIPFLGCHFRFAESDLLVFPLLEMNRSSAFCLSCYS